MRWQLKRWATMAFAAALLGAWLPVASAKSKRNRAPAGERAKPAMVAALAAWQGSLPKALGLPTKAPRIEPVPAAKLADIALDGMRTQYPKESLRWMNRGYRDLGLLAAQDDLEASWTSLYAEPVDALFSVASRTLWVRADADVEALQPALRHEALHALQDAATPLSALVAATAANDDRALALQALLEGQAMVAMEASALAAQAPLAGDKPPAAGRRALKSNQVDLTDANMESLWAQRDEPQAPAPEAAHENAGPAAGPTPAVLRAPALVRAQAAFAAEAGPAFVAAIGKVDPFARGFGEALKRPPQSTREVLHPEAYLAREAAAVADFPPVAAAAAPMVRWQGTVGEWSLRTLFGSDGAAARLAAGWRADRLLVLESSGAEASAWQSRWRDAAAAAAVADWFRARWRLAGRSLGNDRFVVDGRLRALWQREADVAVFVGTLDADGARLERVAGTP